MRARSNEFHIVTRWNVAATVREVADILADPEHFPRWWGDVYLGIRVLERGDANGEGARVAIRSKGRLPYELNWIATVIESRRPETWTVAAEGDLRGRGVWTLIQRGDDVVVDYDWRVFADRPILRALSPVLGPLFAWNHRWAMARGEDGLKAEVLRRRGGSPHQSGSGEPSSRARSIR
ncbi:hypothetical protein DEA8626_02775 [Defluviimonas aquaemixtae]|uniref:Polyketide cyclase n=1 Tax=Albidovulum aquaemixtae TaxID=1542388 RepID=A0A2R8BJZ3_9RHOB|nr:SRPBCC family protein [Defluviimonas aquaemixtae]SPH23709.1 hypothetical protein DEA8626_02775 [Defluviimonas aquaemixtae]